MTDFWEQAQMFFWNIVHQPTIIDCIDILIVAILIYQLFLLTRQTRAVQVIKGLAIIIVGSYVSDIIGLTSLSWLLHSVLNNGAIVLLVLFQPELRKALESIGRGTHIERTVGDTGENARVVDEIINCALRLSRRRVGALIVFERTTGLLDISNNGIPIDSVISSQLLENIFEPNTPLHDGAVIIRGTRIVSAACVLSLSESNSISHDLGTRHRAALGISESTDAIALIVSEETGIISAARGGRLTRHLDASSLRTLLTEMYQEQHSRLWTLLHALKIKKGGAKHDE